MNSSLFIIGGQRSGTSFLRDVLAQHPDIEFASPYNPEPKYFINHPGGTYASFVATYFKNMRPESVIAEKSTSYFEFDDALKRIYQEMNPSVAVFIVRNPVDRAISNYKFSVKNALETRSLEEVFELGAPKPQLKKKYSTDPFNYLGRSRLSQIIPTLEAVFKERLCLIDFEKMISDPQAVANKIFEALHLIPVKILSNVDKNTSFSQDLSDGELGILNRRLSQELTYYKQLQSTNKM